MQKTRKLRVPTKVLQGLHCTKSKVYSQLGVQSNNSERLRTKLKLDKNPYFNPKRRRFALKKKGTR